MTTGTQFEDLTPLMRQFFSIKAQHEDCILLFRLGDFYEMFGEDAKIASKILQIALTTRDKSKDEPIPMCGIPHFSADNYISKLIKAGHKVAICEQMQDPKTAKGIVQREVVKIITPGTYTPEQPKENNYIMSVSASKGLWGIALADLSTAEFFVFESQNPLRDEIMRFEPKEIVHPQGLSSNLTFKEAVNGYYCSAVDDLEYDYTEAYKQLVQYFKVASLDGFGCDNLKVAISSAGALLSYLLRTSKTLSFSKISVFRQSDYMFLDASTCANLELLHNLSDGSSSGTVLWAIDETLTALGGRFLRGELIKPLLSLHQIKHRQQLIEAFLEDYETLANLRIHLRKISDIERITTKIISETVNPRELIALKTSLQSIMTIKKNIQSDHPEISKILSDIPDCLDAITLIDKAIEDNPPLSIKEGGIIKKGFSEEIDRLRTLAYDCKDFLARLEAKEREKTGINSLKIAYNKVSGYYIEVSKSNLHLVPQYFIRKQTLTNVERYITAELKDFETQALSAEERLNALQEAEYNLLVKELQKFYNRLKNICDSIAFLDFILALAVVAKRHDYVKPIVNDSFMIDIKNGRHPVIERMLASSGLSNKFVPNDTLLDSEENNLLIITGPNMAGKSTYMRQTALIVLLAQIGSFVPASYAEIGIADRIFTRIGASDFIARGQSTFMVEMIETANILNNATNRSLIILDEVGRGTSTFDGISIAWAIAEYIVQNIKARTLFATHYHELTELAKKYDSIKNYNIQVKEWGEEIIFLRKIAPGSADKSYGIHVAQLAGLPEKILQRAREVLDELQNKQLSKYKPMPIQLELFSDTNSLADEIMAVDMQKLTPHSALRLVKRLRAIAESA